LVKDLSGDWSREYTTEKGRTRIRRSSVSMVVNEGYETVSVHLTTGSTFRVSDFNYSAEDIIKDLTSE